MGRRSMSPQESAALFWIVVGLVMVGAAVWFLLGWWGVVLVLGLLCLGSGLDSL